MSEIFFVLHVVKKLVPCLCTRNIRIIFSQMLTGDLTFTVYNKLNNLPPLIWKLNI